MRIFRWVRDRFKHKLGHFKPSYLLGILKEHGASLVVIIIAWEIIEDILFPILFIWLGKNINPWFLTGAPISWLICLHPIMVPITWKIWVSIKNKLTP